MCRFALYTGTPAIISDIFFTSTHSIIDQSKHSTEREDPLNGDGFGIAWYRPEVQKNAGILKDITPVWNHKGLKSVANITQSPLFMVHIRDASPAMPVTYPNTHPFSYQNWSCVHNGYIPEFHKIKRDIIACLDDDIFFQIQWNTDSEHFFALFLQYYFSNDSDNQKHKMVESLRSAIQKIWELLTAYNITDPYMLNVMISDGVNIIGSRFHSLWVQGLNTLYINELETSVCIASEPLIDGVMNLQIG